jgi:hypothetical protein
MAEKVLMRDCGDSIRRADAGSFSPSATKTAAYTITLHDAGKTFTNTGATASVALTLPAAKEGFFFRVQKTVAAQPVVITRAASESIDGVAANLTLPVGAVGLYTISSDGTNWYTDGGTAAITEAMLQASSATGLGVVRVAHAKYDFAVDGGGAPGLITPAANATIPAKALVFGGIVKVTAAVDAAGGAATVAIGTSAGSSATSIMGATAKGSLSLQAMLATTPVFTAASSFSMTAAGQITVTSATNALTEGVFEVFVFYVVFN